MILFSGQLDIVWKRRSKDTEHWGFPQGINPVKLLTVKTTICINLPISFLATNPHPNYEQSVSDHSLDIWGTILIWTIETKQIGSISLKGTELMQEDKNVFTCITNNPQREKEQVMYL